MRAAYVAALIAATQRVRYMRRCVCAIAMECVLPRLLSACCLRSVRVRCLMPALSTREAAACRDALRYVPPECCCARECARRQCIACAAGSFSRCLRRHCCYHFAHYIRYAAKAARCRLPYYCRFRRATLTLAAYYLRYALLCRHDSCLMPPAYTPPPPCSPMTRQLLKARHARDMLMPRQACRQRLRAADRRVSLKVRHTLLRLSLRATYAVSALMP